MKRKIFGIGGGGFSEEPDNILLDQYFFSLSSIQRPKVCFIGTASGDAKEYINRFYENMKRHDVEPSHLSLFKGTTGSLRDFVLDKDIFYVGGGNTRNLLTLWRDWGLDKLLLEAYQSGKVIGGISAGSLCWFEHGVTDSVPGQLTKLEALGFLKGSNCVHYDGGKELRTAYHRLILSGMKDGIACDNGVAAIFENEVFAECVSSRQNAKAYFVKRIDGKIIEQQIEPRYLGG